MPNRGHDFFDDRVDQASYLRRQQERAETIRRGEEIMKAETEAAAIRAREATAKTMAANRRILHREYEVAGVRPPFTDFDGDPTVSLSLLLWQGWQVQNVSGENVLVAPQSYRGKQK